MKRRSEDVATRRPLRRFEHRAGWRWSRGALARFWRRFLPLIQSFQRLAAPFPSDRAGSRLNSDSLEYLALLPVDGRRAGNNF